jgi:predicted aspartyl protease|tara:strand:+ start:446 stop:709 length:264 start_codon:yes stop_codon:yes gene_type:complete
MAKKATKKTEVRKITQEELQEVNQYATAINQVQMQIGGVEMQKSDLIAEMAKLRAGMQEVQNALMATYGDVTVNLTDGTITDNASNS